MKFGSLFAGIGGFDLGLERAGMTSTWQVEIDDYCQKVLAKHWPAVPRHRDVKEVGPHNLEPVDLICGGFPCQDLSYAGKGAGITGARSGLWAEFARIIREMEPRYVIVENVPALLTRGIEVVLGDLAEIGYDAEWNCISAASVGAPHLRNRIWIIAYPKRQRWHEGCLKSREPLVLDEDTPISGRLASMGQFSRVACVETRNEAITQLVRRDDGVPNRMDRLKGLGNAIVPQIAELIGNHIMAKSLAD
jgi:DNA (cytosine-5)-methyltransferase 1